MISDDIKEKNMRPNDMSKYKHKFGRIRIGQYGLGKRGFRDDKDQTFFEKERRALEGYY